ncbi:MAG: VOC family protein [Pseudomonadota bacterium]
MTVLLTAQPARHASPTVKVQQLAYLIWERPNLDQTEAFLTDFGLTVAARSPSALYLRGSAAAPFCYMVRLGAQARFLGLALEVDSEQALQRLARLPGASPAESLTSPGGGRVVRLRDPSGFLVEAVFGQTPYAALPQRQAMTHNTADHTSRINKTQRVPAQPPEVIRLGHVVLEVANFQATCAWYTQHFGFIPSDVQVLPDGSPAVTFLRLDLGDIPADHHTLAIAQGFMATYSHSAYEVVDADAVGMGQRVLRERGYKHAWGIGRHILGSQIFDYWNDPWNFRHEHYSDGDVFTAERPMGIHPVSKGAMAQWGPTMPTSFTKPHLTLHSIAALIRNLRHSPDLTLAKLKTLAKIFA